MRDDWTAGDLALCVNSRGWRDAVSLAPVSGPRAGQVLTVRQVTFAGASWRLEFACWPKRFNAKAFRKITPEADIHGIEAEARHPLPSLWPVPA